MVYKFRSLKKAGQNPRKKDEKEQKSLRASEGIKTGGNQSERTASFLFFQNIVNKTNNAANNAINNDFINGDFSSSEHN